MDKWLIFSTFIVIVNSENYTLIQQTRSGFLEKYKSYANTALMHFEIPADISEAQFKLRGSDLSYSIFGCGSQEVIILLKYGSPPVINPDGSKFPEDFFLNSTSENHYLQFVSSNTDFHYINLSSPFPGTYYAIAFFPYTNPKDDILTQQGLSTKCNTYIDANLYIKEYKNIEIITNDVDISVNIHSKDTENIIYKLYIPVNIDRLLLIIKNVKFCDKCTKLIARAQAYNIPSIVNNTYTYNITKIGYDGKEKNGRFDLIDEIHYYIKFEFENNDNITDILGSFKFKIKYFSSLSTYNDESNTITKERTKDNETIELETNALKKLHKLETTFTPMIYEQYHLHKSMSSESFMYTYDMKALKDGSVPMAVNLTNEGFSVLRFNVLDKTDIGGLLQFIFAFKPKIIKVGSFKRIIPEPENNTIIICVRNRYKEIPSWPSNCLGENRQLSPVILNATQTNLTISVPFPEAGDWFVSMKLFCGVCEPCDCPTNCINEYRNCTDDCEINCTDAGSCDGCSKKCENIVISKDGCKGCDCDGNCKKNKEKSNICNTTVIFDISSYPCVAQSCGNNGKCVFMVHEGFVYSTCICSNNYRGWDCSDDANANSFAFILSELLLLVLSNLVFLPAVYIAYRRKYYIESIVYFSTCFSSTFYHSCDAGENILSFCITKLDVLQFADFYCASLSIWFTLIAMANLKRPIFHIFHVFGAILIACFTHANKQSLWVFLLPVIVGLIIIAARWGKEIYFTRTLYPAKRYWKIYLPCGIVLVIIGITLFTMFQTKNNYKYVHSVWHIIMAVAVVILLPDKKTFEINPV